MTLTDAEPDVDTIQLFILGQPCPRNPITLSVKYRCLFDQGAEAIHCGILSYQRPPLEGHLYRPFDECRVKPTPDQKHCVDLVEIRMIIGATFTILWDHHLGGCVVKQKKNAVGMFFKSIDKLTPSKKKEKYYNLTQHIKSEY